MNKKTAYEIFDILIDLIKYPKTELIYSTDFELLVAVILSAQCTDKRVNLVTKDLFKKYNTPIQFAGLKQEELEILIHPCGFYKNKAKNIIEASKVIVEKYNGCVPQDFDELVKLPGVGRKTASVMLIVAYNLPAMPVDTHVFRVSNRIGLAKTNNVLECENQLKKLYKKDDWGNLHHLLILFGRYYCKAIKPQCENCVLKNYCSYFSKNNK